MYQSHDHNKGDSDLLTLLLQDPIDSWGAIYRRIQTRSQEAKDRYYRNESPFQLALKAKERKWEAHSSAINDITLDREHSTVPTKKSHTTRIHVLEALILVDPDAILWRDDEGRTPLHTACSAGRSFEILQWLLEQEKTRRQQCVGKGSVCSKGLEDVGAMSEGNATFRTDHPGGALALHSVAACSVFDDFYFRTNGHVTEGGAAVDDTTYLKCMEQFERCPVPVKLSPNILAAYASTTAVIKANPNAMWDRDCEGEIPLHCAASWGNIGTVLALLNGATDGELQEDKIISTRPAVTSAALILNDRRKNSLDCACERVVAFGVRGKRDYFPPITTSSVEDRREIPVTVSERSSAREDIVREDPFRGSGIGRSRIGVGSAKVNEYKDRGSALRTSISTGDRRTSFSSSFILSGGLFGLHNDQPNSDVLRASFTSRRRPVHPVRGIALDEDGDEEFVKVELLACAACGHFGFERNLGVEKISLQTLHARASNVEGSCPARSEQSRSDSFHLVHEVIKLGCPPEVVWHAASKYPFEVTTKDAMGRVPLSLACERLVGALAVDDEEMKAKHYCVDPATPQGSDLVSDRNESDNFNAARTLVESFFLGDSTSLPDFPTIDGNSSSCAARNQEMPQVERSIPSTTSSSILPPTNDGCKSSPILAPKQQESFAEASFAVEIINMLLYSSVFGSKAMASTPNDERRLPLHIILEAVPWIDVREEEENNPDQNESSSSKETKIEQTKLVDSLIDAYPRALESRDGILL
eukprot:CCRYP_004319-RD/>CCRYP_004319-RD protein AED:0.16 eAED:0.16 QI:363/1/1/1/0/0/5/1728/758